MVVEEIEMAARQPFNFGQRGVNGLRIEALPALEERLLIAEVTDMGATARNDQRVWH